MEILLYTIGLPTIGLLMLLCWRGMLMTGINGSVLTYKSSLSILSGLLFASLLPQLFFIFSPLISPTAEFSFSDILITIVRLFLFGVVLRTGVNARTLVREPFNEEPTVSQLAMRADSLKSLLAGSLALLALPLLAIGAIPLLIVWGFGFVDLFLFEVVSRARRGRLLWTLAVTAQSNKPFEKELLHLARSESKRQRKKLQLVAAGLEEGNSLSHSLTSVPGLLPREMLAAISCGEESGRLTEVLSSLAQEQMTGAIHWLQYDFKHFGIHSYLFANVLFLALVISLTTLRSLPRLRMIVTDFGMELPVASQWLFNFGPFWNQYWFLILTLAIFPLTILMIGPFLALGSDGRFRKAIGSLWPRLNVPQLLKVLSLAVRANARPVQIMEKTLLGMPPSLDRARLERLSIRLNSGEPLSTAMRREHLLTRREAQALILSEQRGHLAWGLDSLARRIEFGRAQRAQTIVAFLGPLSVFVMGGCVFFFCLAILSLLIQILNLLA